MTAGWRIRRKIARPSRTDPLTRGHRSSQAEIARLFFLPVIGGEIIGEGVNVVGGNRRAVFLLHFRDFSFPNSPSETRLDTDVIGRMAKETIRSGKFGTGTRFEFC